MNEIIEQLTNIKDQIQKARDIALEAPELGLMDIDADDARKLDNAMSEIFSILSELCNS